MCHWTLSGRDSVAVILLTFSNWFPCIKLLYFLSQFSLKHGVSLSATQSLDTSNLLGSTQNDCHFTDKCIFLHGNCCIFLKIPFNLVNDVFQIFLDATKQLYEWFSPSVCLSVRHTFFALFPSLHYPEIFGSYYQSHKWCSCKRSRSEVKGQGHRGHNPT